MIPHDKMMTGDSLVKSLMSAASARGPGRSDKDHPEYRTLRVVLKRFKKSPDVLRLMLQNEFQFDGMVVHYDKSMTEEELLNAEWYNSCFVYPNFGNVEAWLEKCVLERDKGKNIVVLVPARTNTGWFHNIIIPACHQIRFIEGRVTIPGTNDLSPSADLLAIFLGKQPPPGFATDERPDRLKEKPAPKIPESDKVGIISCDTRFTDARPPQFRKVEDEGGSSSDEESD